MSLIQNYWWVTLLGVLALVWAGREWRRMHRRRIQVTASVSSRTFSAAPFRRSDFEAKAERVRARMAKGAVIGMGIFLIGSPSLFALSWLVPQVRGGVFSIAMFALLVAAFAPAFASAISASWLMKRIGLVCPACGVELVGYWGRFATPPPQTVVLETGRCRACGAQLLDRAEVGPPTTQKVTRADHARALSLAAVLLAGLAAIIYFANATLTARHIAYCNRRYAAAHGPADSGATDTLQLTRSGTITCGDFRRAGRLVPPP